MRRTTSWTPSSRTELIAAYGVSVETVDQALSAIARPHVASVQIILNAFRLKPLDEVLPAAAAAGVGIIARVPLASGLLSGKYDLDTTFAPDDHRTYNRDGSSFDVGETFSGVDYAHRGLGGARVRRARRDERAGRAHACAGGHRLGVAASRGDDRDPGRPQPRPGARQRRGRRGRAVGRGLPGGRSAASTTGTSATRSTAGGDHVLSRVAMALTGQMLTLTIPT